MQACKIFLAAVSLCFYGTLSAQSIGSISAPTMPSINAPEFGTSFYKPGKNSFYNPYHKEGLETTNDYINDKHLIAPELNETLEEKIISSITASDISGMNKLGLLNTVSFSDRDSQTKVILDKVLKELEDIKQSNSFEAPKEKITESLPASAQHTPSQTKHSSKLLRFSVNNYDILKTCSRIFISDIQQDGTFLVTGDRRYQSDGKTRKETFHILFKTADNAKDGCNYTAASSVTQDYKNEYSFLYQMAQKTRLDANRTGNLVSMRTKETDWNLEFLIDLGE